MKLSQIIENVKAEIVGNISQDFQIENLCDNSKFATKNSLFFCMQGKNHKGSEFVVEAISRGAVCIVTDKILRVNIPQIIVDDIFLAQGQMCANFYQNPQKKMQIVEVVGTNGKTSTVKILQHIFEYNYKKCGIFSTGSIQYDGETFAQANTTPNVIEMFKHMSVMQKCGIRYLFMEMSAQGIEYKKYFPLKAKVGVFTNCKSEHMEFFQDFESYKKTKASFFCKQNCEYALLNIDDPLSMEILKKCDAVNLTYGLKNPADCFAIEQKQFSFVANIFDRIIEQKHNLYGTFNVYNLLCAMSVATILGLDQVQIYEAICNLKQIEGRFNVINFDNKVAIIDYAHTEEAMKNVVNSALEITKNKLIVLFGCGGERDVQKRAKMGKFATENADFVIITSDNPRFEEPTKIMDDIEKGIVKNNYVKIENRKDAILFAKNYANEGDTILILGKGNEKYQEICGIKYPFCDKNMFEK